MNNGYVVIRGCNTMIQGLARLLIAIVYLCPIWAAAQSTDPLPPQTQLVAVSGAPAATQETFRPVLTTSTSATAPPISS